MINTPQHHIRIFEHLADLNALVGEKIAASDWYEVNQQRINEFASATSDRQWIHVDPERAAAGPFGKTIAHGFFTLSLIPMFWDQSLAIAGVGMVINCGVDRVRFTAPVPVGSRLRAHFSLVDAKPSKGGTKYRWDCTIEREGEEKPVCVAEYITLCLHEEVASEEQSRSRETAEA